MIRVTGAVVELTERTLRAMVEAVEQAKTEVDFITAPMPQGDMTTSSYINERARRGAIRVESSYSDVVFEIGISNTMHDAENVGYKLRPIEPGSTSLGRKNVD